MITRTICSEISLRDIKQTLHRLDLINRPYIFYCNPSDKYYVRLAIGNDQIIETATLVNDHAPKGTWLVI